MPRFYHIATKIIRARPPIQAQSCIIVSMGLILSALLATLACAAPSVPSKPVSGITLTDAQAMEIGKKIFQNEAGGKIPFLTHWNDGEDFASLGIGHFIWYHDGAPGPFT